VRSTGVLRMESGIEKKSDRSRDFDHAYARRPAPIMVIGVARGREAEGETWQPEISLMRSGSRRLLVRQVVRTRGR
jgi:hypothetical protein